MTEVVDLSRFSRTRADLERFALKNPDYDPTEFLEKLERNTMAKYQKTCAFILCNSPFVAERKDESYCKGACKQAAYRMRQYGAERSELATLLQSAHEAEEQFQGVAGASPDKITAKRRRDDTLRAAYDAIGAELGIVHETPVDEPEDEPENDASPDPLESHVLRAKLREFMAETGYGQNRIAKLADVNQATISKFVRNLTDGSEAFRQSIFDVISQDHGMDRR